MLFVSTPTFAVTYSNDVNVRFTFNSEINIVIDSADIEILDLAPGTSSDSNVVGITISTNNVVGYTASATVGNSTYNTTSMTNTNGVDAFTSIATDASQASLSTDNTWGYTTSLDNGSSWANLSGLPIYTETPKEIATTNSPANDAIKFKINAKASTSQTAGDYKNVINFTVVANVPPKTIEDAIDISDPAPPIDPETKLHTMQSMSEDVCDIVEAIDEQTRLTDTRDHKTYWVAKLKDGRCWMTQNLDFDIDSTKTYTNADTDLGWNGVRYTTASWQPLSSTISSENIRQDGYITAWESNSSEPVSFDPGDWYWYMNGGWYSGSNNYLAGDVGDPVKFSTTAFSENGTHGHLGNYYNLPAATANNNYSASGTSAQPNSICPKNWGLPPITSAGLTMNNLANYYGNTTGSDQYIAADPTYFVRGGQISARYLSSENITVGTLGLSGDAGFYWYDRRVAMNNNSSGISMSSPDAYLGNSIRCTVRTMNKVTLSYNANGGTGAMPTQEVKINRSIQLANNQFERSGYKFMGWNLDPNGLDLGYGEGDTFTANVSESTTSITLYAQWEEDPGSQGGGGYQGRTLARAYEEAYLYNGGNFDTESSEMNHRGMFVPERDAQGNYTGNYFEATKQSDYDGIPARDLRFAMQDANLLVDGQKICDRTTVVGSSVHLLDLRDNKSYWATKLKDGQCWMTQNLDFNLTAGVTLTSQDTDLGWDKVNNQYSAGVTSWTPARTTINASNVTNGVISSWENNYDYDISVDVGDWYWDGGENRNTSNNYLAGDTGGVFKKNEMFSLTQEHGHVGNYYNWTAATAHSQSGNVPPVDSICPKYWRLPYINTYEGGGADGIRDFRNLIPLYARADGDWVVNGYQVSGNVAVRHPLYFVQGGYISTDKTIIEAGFSGRYWTSGTNNNEYFPGNAWYLQFDFSRIDEWDHTYNMHYSVGYNGKSVRCLMR